MMKLIVGLGNPGRQYEATRHNVGFQVIDALAKRHQVRLSQRGLVGRRLVARYGDWNVQEITVRLLCPQTMMNASGEALGLVTSWGVEPASMLVVCDDVNLPLGTLRMRAQGSAGGHHGLASCLARLGTDALPRLRVGVGVQPLPNDLTEMVLSPFRSAERPLIEPLVTRAAEACEVWATDGIHAAMNHTNVREP